jgi:hypothetical protein
MDSFYCTLPFVIMLPAVMIGLGLIYVFNKDWAWRIAESLLSSVKPQRTAKWEIYSTINGVIMLVGGLIFTGFLLYMLLVD